MQMRTGSSSRITAQRRTSHKNNRIGKDCADNFLASSWKFLLITANSSHSEFSTSRNRRVISRNFSRSNLMTISSAFENAVTQRKRAENSGQEKRPSQLPALRSFHVAQEKQRCACSQHGPGSGC